jgi:hypothetical protein
MLSDDVYDEAEKLFETVRKEHHRLHKLVKASDHPELIYAASYQDGMMHALERACQMRDTGVYSQGARIHRVIGNYLEWQKEKLHSGNYEDVAYIEGYVNALIFLLLESKDQKKSDVPLYFMFGAKGTIPSLTAFITKLNKKPIVHKASQKRAMRYLRKLSDPGAIEFHHPPWL